MDFATAMHVLLLKNIKGIFPTGEFRLEVFLLVLTRHFVILAVFHVLLCSLKGTWYERLTHEKTFLRWFSIGVSRMQVWRTLHEEDLYPYHDQGVQHL
jgi:hypothetical protein